MGTFGFAPPPGFALKLLGDVLSVLQVTFSLGTVIYGLRLAAADFVR